MTLIKLPPRNKTLKGHKLVITDPRALPEDALPRLRARFPDLQVQPFDADATDPWEGATLALGSGRNLPSIDKAGKLELFQLTSAGADGLVGKPIFDDTEIAFCTASGVHGRMGGEHLSRLPASLARVPRKSTPRPVGTLQTLLPRSHPPPSLSPSSRALNPTNPINLPRGILGYGSVGRQVARVCKAVGMTVHAYTLHPRRTPSSRRDPSYAPPGLGDPDGLLPDRWFAGASAAELHAFLSSGLDLLVVALPLTPQTRGRLAAREFAALRGAFVSNVGRGPIVNTADLVEALEGGVIRGAALDVTDPEPLPADHPLWRARNVTITPHVSGESSKYMERVFEVLLENLTRLSNGERLMNLINRREGY
ncbi:NAD(P)-binding domain protein [Cordyceps fumosorosea ARSEF 2679]|uniref:NAD(P)-binding domain protein n=1 Tax=Cordyceps fumosorosea (strain ARSEF 2679) TaxID=1081104 RepID=A0A168B5C9_CORFA|nr:NAD(P)-binding domain protein [Cordyceps fumosorosea ARSEF 2679]OAA69640.1 NAD(P)-binding domain protein [Cordyceps fumosorosea ARSEF 2679]